MKKGILLVLLGMVITLSGCGKDDVVKGIIFSLEGDTEIDLFVGDTYTDAGFTATDSEVDISEYVTINGTVDTSVAGNYFIEYVLAYNEQTRMVLRTVVVSLTNTEISEEIFDSITMVTETIEDIRLKTSNSEFSATIVWSSDTVATISDTGAVVRPEFGVGNASVIMTATVTIDSVDYTKDFTVVVTEAEEPFTGTGTEIFISEYIEGGSYNKAIELFNPTGSDITLDTYTLILYSNGTDVPTSTAVLDDVVISSGGTIVLCNAQSSNTILDICDIQNSYVVNFNGNDAVGLYKDEVLIDVFGVIGENPEDFVPSVKFWAVGEASTKDYTLVRNPSVTGPVATWDPTEWTAFAKDTFTELGAHITD